MTNTTSNRRACCTTRFPLHLGHMAAPSPDGRELLRVGHLVQGPTPELGQGPFRLQSSGEDIRSGGLSARNKSNKQLCPSTHRPAIPSTNSRYQAHFPRQPKDFTSTTKNGLRDQKGGITPALFLLPTTCKRPTDKASSMATSDRYTRRFGYSTHATNTLTTGAKVFSSDLG